ncbi:MAG TPA: DUF2796 domain-containing protein [Hyphomicrobium sp.]
MRTHITFALAALAAVSLASASLRAEEEHRELGAHEHGHGTLNIAVENKRVAMELEVPGMDIVGFEHEATSDDQKAAVDKAKAELAKPLTLFKLPASAGCSVKEAKVEIEAEHEDADHEKHAKAEDHDDEKHADADHDEDEHEGHNAFHVTYALDCAKPAELTSITFDYFKAFAGAQNLTVNVVTAKAQNAYEVSRDKPELDLGGTM